MFAKATTNFVTEIDPDGCLVPVFRLNESDNLALLSLVIKRKRFWFWQQPKYLTTDFSLNDVLVGDKDIDTAVIETDFLKYNSTLQSNTSGGADADFGPGRVNVGGEGSSKLASSFGNLTKQEIDLKRLLDDSKDRVLDLQHSLVQQTRENRREVLGVVKECITTTQPCTISEVVHKVGSCGAFLGFTVPRKIQVSVKNGGHQSNSSVSVEIPANTALAYSIIELRVKSTGRFDLCLMPHNLGGFETDGMEKGVTVLCSTPPEAPNRQPLQEELEKLQPQFKVLSDLPSNTRHCLFQQFSILLKDRTAISVLDLALEDVSCGKKPDLSSLDKVPSLRSAVQTILELFQGDDGTGDAQADSTSSGKQLSHSAMSATHLLSSALEEMNDSVLSVLESCCCPRTIQALQLLVQHVVENKKCSLKDSTLAILGDENRYSQVVKLFGSSDVVLSKEEDSVSAQLGSQQGHMPHVLCIAICALASLAPLV
ncbi:gasdermin Eb [Electrophorus electricus]|uniref:Gasdermin Eb n=1 Tax=Electrophorus electricus TaxID=8005 RepID=A0A4W4G0Q0_ELEEL|nr:gasdermin Eb [Electrophorus electricus]